MKNKKNGFIYYLKKSYKYSGNKKHYLIIYSILYILLMAINLVEPLLAAKSILYLTESNLDKLLIIVILEVVIGILSRIIRYYNNIVGDLYFSEIRINLAMSSIKESLKITNNEMNKTTTGAFIEKITDDTETISSVFLNVIDTLTSLLTGIGVIVAIYFISPPMFVIYIIFVIVQCLIQKESYKAIIDEWKKYKNKKDKTTGFITEVIRGSRDIKILNAEESFLVKTNEEFRDNAKTYIKYIKTWNFKRQRDRCIYILFDFAISIVGIILMRKELLIASTLLIIYQYKSSVANFAENVGYLLDYVERFNLASKRVMDLIEGDTYEKEHFGKKHIDKLEGNIRFNNVKFRYDKDHPYVLNGMSFQIKPNETIAFVGKSGGGKSTIFNLISALNYCNKGEILLDGKNIKQLDKDTIRGNLSVISQSPYIFNLSIRDNLKVIKKDLTEEEMIEACKEACLHDFIMSLKDGYDTIVGEGGVTLSGGQRQRLAIARALVQKTEIILFDEATSALDNKTQSEIEHSIKNMQGTYTILIIAHRLSTVINADKIFFVSDGVIKASGTHKELLKNCKEYKELYELELTK